MPHRLYHYLICFYYMLHIIVFIHYDFSINWILIICREELLELKVNCLSIIRAVKWIGPPLFAPGPWPICHTMFFEKRKNNCMSCVIIYILYYGCNIILYVVYILYWIDIHMTYHVLRHISWTHDWSFSSCFSFSFDC